MVAEPEISRLVDDFPSISGFFSTMQTHQLYKKDFLEKATRFNATIFDFGNPFQEDQVIFMLLMLKK